MNSYFKDNIINHTKEFTSSGFYRTITRKGGSEIITVSDGKITLTRLYNTGKDPAITTIDSNVSFEPIEILLNECEQLLCIYDRSNCSLYSLNKEGSKFILPISYKLKLDLLENENILQVIFNNVSKFQSEIVILTNNEIKCYNINLSLNTPVQRYNFEKEYELNKSRNTYDLSGTIVDPVSICFASCPINTAYEFETIGQSSNNSPQNDLTLYLLTSDASIYKIYPFFPYELSVSSEWISNLFDTTTLVFKSLKNNKEQLQMMPSIKVCSYLLNSQDSKNIVINQILPSVYRKGKITGPLSMESFPEELYAFEALKILSLPNDILVIIFNHTVIVFNRILTSTMIFENQNTEPDDSLLLLDSLIFNENSNEICTAMIHPVTRDSIFVTGSNGSLIQIDFSQWFDSLTIGLNSGNLTEFNKLCQNEKLPTEVILLGKMKLNKESKSNDDITLRSHENNIWFAWNTRDVYAMVIKEGSFDVLSMFLVSTAKKDDDTKELEELENKNEKEEEDKLEKNKYHSYLKGSFKNDILPQINISLGKIAEINNMMKQFPVIILNEETATISDLKNINKLSELATSGQLILFKVLSTLSQRLRMMTIEYHNQINSYHKVMLEKQDILNKFFELKTKYANAIDKQDKLNRRMVLLISDVEKIENNNIRTNISISYQENAYFKELARIRDFVQKKERELSDINVLIENVKNAEMSVLRKNKEALLNDFHNKRSLDGFKSQLESQSTIINYLIEHLNELSLEAL